MEISAALASAQFVGRSLTALLKLKIDSSAMAQVAEAIEKLTEVQASLLASQQLIGDQQEQIRSLKQEIQQHENWEARASQYELINTGLESFVYRYLGQPAHTACPRCFEDRYISILQGPTGEYSGLSACQRCNARIQVRDAKAVSYPSGFV